MHAPVRAWLSPAGRLGLVRALYAAASAVALVTYLHAVPSWLDVNLKEPIRPGLAAPPTWLVMLDLGASLAVPVACAVVAALIARYKSADLYGLFASIEILLFGLVISGPWSAVAVGDPWSGATRLAQKLALVAILTLLCIFPTRRFTPSWTLWLALSFAAWMAVGMLVPRVDPVLARGVWQVLLLLFFLGALGAFGYRYRRVLNPSERRQTAWLIYGSALVIAAYVLWSILRFGLSNLTAATAGDILLQLTSIAFAVAYAVAIFRFRVYDIDLVINRTVVYGAATAFLVLAFAALSELSTLVIEKLTGRSSGIMTIPLIVAAALSFSPLQRRIRPIVDRMLPPRSVLTILMTDVANSTNKAVEMGDTRWRQTLTAYRSTVRQALRRFKGSEMDTAGDGFFAVFDRAADALRAAEWCRTTLQEAGLDSRFGLHAGECETRGEKVSGVAVITAARVMAQAQANEILVTAAGRDALSEDPGGGFADRGFHALKGLPGEFHLYEVTQAPPIGLKVRRL